jgi:hypothetical protein
MRAHWIDIKRYLTEFPSDSIIRFKATEANRLDGKTFRTLFLPTVLNQTPEIPFSQALALLQSTHYEESYLGLVVLFRRYPNELQTWTKLIEYFRTRPIANIPSVLIYYLAHIPWHGDIFYRGEPITDETREHVGRLLQEFGTPETLKLLAFIDSENMLSRGSLGQSVEAIISCMPHAESLLESIANDVTAEFFVRECAALILAMHIGESAMPTLQKLAGSGSSYARELITYLQDYGFVNPYS